MSPWIIKIYFSWPINDFFFPFRLCVILLHPCEYQERHHSSIWWTLLKLCNCVPLQFCYSKLHTHKLCTQGWASRLFPLLLLSSHMEIRILICLNNVSLCKLQTKNLWLNVCLINNLLRFYIYLNKICGIGLNNVVNVSKYFLKVGYTHQFILIRIVICMRLI